MICDKTNKTKYKLEKIEMSHLNTAN